MSASLIGKKYIAFISYPNQLFVLHPYIPIYRSVIGACNCIKIEKTGYIQTKNILP